VLDAIENLPRGPYDTEFRVVRPDGEQRWVWSRGFPIPGARGRNERVASITEDITERKLAAESRPRLIRGFTHDVKNPLGAADGFLALLEQGIQGPLTAEQAESIARVRRSIRAAVDLTGQLLDIARAEAGQLDLEVEPIRVDEIAREVIEEFRAKAAAKGLSLEYEPARAGTENPLTIESDQQRVRQVLANLLSNAVKYTSAGGVTVRVSERTGQDAPRDGDWVTVAVADTGHGISLEKQAMLFREFSRFEPDAAEGSGIGLAISQRIAEALGGSITYASRRDAGSIFTLWLPRRQHAD
jgi:signal transduction histidine kinase